MSTEDENVTETGVEDSDTEFGSLPNWPNVLDPKHHVRVDAATHECAKPVAADDADPPPNTGTRLGVRTSDAAVVPKRPLSNAPQHHVSPTVLTAHV